MDNYNTYTQNAMTYPPVRKKSKVGIVILVSILLVVVGGLMAFVSAIQGGVNSVIFDHGPKVVLNSEDERDIQIDEQFEKFDSIDLNVDYAAVTLVKGNEFSVKGNVSSGNNHRKIAVDAGKLIVEISRNEGFSLFSFDFGFFHSGHDEKIIVTYNPEMLESGALEDVQIQANLGDLTIDDLNCKSLTADVDTGKSTISNVVASGKIAIENNLGNANVSNITCSDLLLDVDTGSAELADADIKEHGKIDANLGSIKLSDIQYGKLEVDADTGDVTAANMVGGKLTGDLNLGDYNAKGVCKGSFNISIDTGSATFDISERADDIAYDLTTDLGEIKINNNKMGTTHQSGQNNASIDLKIETDLGDITINTARS
ncbi:MAG: DUF4097 domain-containing protein [Clostridiales Family XIII bacterium]|jgi:DUF4097 and DUF4098 domain-containing protein YvlB|nr:DUF4097 domain-containing protein [Clostridiales Family XIII bacterium]